jgi:hypothetical protein
MKRIINALIIVAMAIMLICAMVISVNAVDREIAGNTQVIAKIENQFTCRIPAEIDLSTGDTSTVTINYARLGSDKVINVYCVNCVGDNGIVLTNTQKTDKTIYCALKNLELNQYVKEDIPICTFRSTDIEDMSASKNFALEFDSLGGEVGEYRGLLRYAFDIESE